ncbi:hypothetical protein U9M48_000788 [Paspalum notatum var. saurae]|uniref:Uncharacterized protein n=1 Tax=Paspalum notatum var. saurae TaxID=547442 RepID=A0AAQ3PKS0_PASNO
MKGGEVKGIVGLVSSVLGEVRRVIEEDRKLNGRLKNGLELIRDEMELVTAQIADNDENYQEAAQETRILQLQELAYDMEDFVLSLWAPGGYGRKLLMVIGMDRRQRHLDRIEHFKERIKNLMELKPTEARAGSSCLLEGDGDDVDSSYASEAELVGITKPKLELLELLSSPAVRGQKLRVVAVVGRRGVGKTALVRAVYEHARRSGAFHRVAWVPRCNHADPRGISKKILEDFGTPGPGSATSTDLPAALVDMRYLVVIDDVQQANLWKGIKHLFPESYLSSRVIVTTNVLSVATTCSTGCYVYTMQDLCNAESQNLFWRKVELSRSEALEGGLDSIFDKCDGLPLAVISVANHLLDQGQNWTVVDVEHLGQSLGKYLASSTTMETAFQKMRRSLVQCYDGLPEHVDRTFLLSMSMFPKGAQIKNTSLVRKLAAEGLVVGDVRLKKEDVAYGCLKKLIDRSIVDSVCNGMDSIAKRCQVHGIMLEFVIHKSVYKNFATLIHKDDLVPKYESPYLVRRLSIHDGTAESKRLATKLKLSATRWLTISNCTDLLDLKNFRLLRLLDLEGCNGIDNIVMNNICKLLFLKYLSLRDTDVKMVPKKIKKLKCLETLDIRGTGVKNLPVEVFLLPLLTYLFGRFELPHLSNKTIQTMLCLHTLAGVILNKDFEGFNQIMLHATNLKKVKIWCTDAPPTSSNLTFWYRLRQRCIGSKALESLSIDSGHVSNDFMSHINAPCAIRSIKIRGVLQCLPGSITLSGLKSLIELYLVSTGLSCEALSALQNLPRLVYLKLVEERDGFWGGSFIVKNDGFRSLQRLCFEAPRLPQVIIEGDGMSLITSLQLLCSQTFTPVYLPHFLVSETAQLEHWLGVMGISCLERLNEVVLHRDVADARFQAWKRLAAQHQNLPYVKKQSV